MLGWFTFDVIWPVRCLGFAWFHETQLQHLHHASLRCFGVWTEANTECLAPRRAAAHSPPSTCNDQRKSMPRCQILSTCLSHDATPPVQLVRFQCWSLEAAYCFTSCIVRAGYVFHEAQWTCPSSLGKGAYLLCRWQGKPKAHPCIDAFHPKTKEIHLEIRFTHRKKVTFHWYAIRLLEPYSDNLWPSTCWTPCQTTSPGTLPAKHAAHNTAQRLWPSKVLKKKHRDIENNRIKRLKKKKDTKSHKNLF